MNNRRDFRSLTALKGLFILVIVLHNTFSIKPLFDAFPGTSFLIAFGGMLGNSMFFILSGFLLAHSYRQRIKTHEISFQDYLVRRLRKLYPLYLVTNIMALMIDIARYGLSAINLKKIVFTLLLQIGGGLENGNPYNSPTWFLSALFICYIVFYFVCYYAQKPTQYYCAIAFGIIWGYALLCADRAIPFCYRETGTGYMNFFIGCALAELYPRIEQKTHRWLKPGSFLSLAACGYLLLRYGVEIISGDVNVAFSFVISPLILYLAFADGLCSKVLQLKPLVWLGKISTAIFFWHLVMYYLFCDLLGAMIPGSSIQEPTFVLYIIVLLVFSAVSSRYVESKPLLRN